MVERMNYDSIFNNYLISNNDLILKFKRKVFLKIFFFLYLIQS